MKKVIILIIVVFAAFILVSCGNKMNDMQIEAEQHERDGLKAIMDYCEGSKSEDKLNNLKEEWEQKIDDVIDYRDELMEKYDLEIDRNEEKIGDFYKLKRAAD